MLVVCLWYKLRLDKLIGNAQDNVMVKLQMQGGHCVTRDSASAALLSFFWINYLLLVKIP